MGWFRQTPMPLEYGEPIHQMVARACLTGGIQKDSDTFGYIRWRFSGPHGICYEGEERSYYYASAAQGIAQICEKVQQDFNERIAAMNKAREYAREQLTVPPLFTSVTTTAAAA